MSFQWCPVSVYSFTLFVSVFAVVFINISMFVLFQSSFTEINILFVLFVQCDESNSLPRNSGCMPKRFRSSHHVAKLVSQVIDLIIIHNSVSFFRKTIFVYESLYHICDRSKEFVSVCTVLFNKVGSRRDISDILLLGFSCLHGGMKITMTQMNLGKSSLLIVQFVSFP